MGIADYDLEKQWKKAEVRQEVLRCTIYVSLPSRRPTAPPDISANHHFLIEYTNETFLPCE